MVSPEYVIEGNLTYLWEALDGGTITGEGASVTFDPSDTDQHPCPYRVKVTATSDQSGLSTEQTIGIYVPLEGDNEHDGDVDGKDLYTLAGGFDSSELAAFAENFGRNDGCPCP